MILFYNPFLACKFLQCRRHGGLQVPQDKSNTFLLIKGGLFLKIEEQDLRDAGDIAVYQSIQKLLLDTQGIGSFRYFSPIPLQDILHPLFHGSGDYFTEVLI